MSDEDEYEIEGEEGDPGEGGLVKHNPIGVILYLKKNYHIHNIYSDSNLNSILILY